jgi:hypothetical protein
MSFTADEARRHVAELRELDLKLAFAAARALREDIENEARAIDDAALERVLEVALLHARQRMVEDHEIGCRLAALRGDVLDLALAGERRSVRAAAPPGDAADDFRTRRCSELGELGEPRLDLAVTEVELDEQRALGVGAVAGRAIEHQRTFAATARSGCRTTCDIRSRRRPRGCGAASRPGATGRPSRSRACRPSASPCS